MAQGVPHLSLLNPTQTLTGFLLTDGWMPHRHLTLSYGQTEFITFPLNLEKMTVRGKSQDAKELGLS